MIKKDCLNYDGDEDCHKCCKYGFIFGCEEDCPEYVNFWTKKSEGQQNEKI